MGRVARQRSCAALAAGDGTCNRRAGASTCPDWSRENRLMMTGETTGGDTILDLRGLRCPYPVLRAKKALRALPVGATLVLECTDPLTVIDVPHFVNPT